MGIHDHSCHGGEAGQIGDEDQKIRNSPGGILGGCVLFRAGRIQPGNDKPNPGNVDQGGHGPTNCRSIHPTAREAGGGKSRCAGQHHDHKPQPAPLHPDIVHVPTLASWRLGFLVSAPFLVGLEDSVAYAGADHEVQGVETYRGEHDGQEQGADGCGIHVHHPSEEPAWQA